MRVPTPAVAISRLLLCVSLCCGVDTRTQLHLLSEGAHVVELGASTGVAIREGNLTQTAAAAAAAPGEPPPESRDADHYVRQSMSEQEQQDLDFRASEEDAQNRMKTMQYSREMTASLMGAGGNCSAALCHYLARQLIGIPTSSGQRAYAAGTSPLNINGSVDGKSINEMDDEASLTIVQKSQVYSASVKAQEAAEMESLEASDGENSIQRMVAGLRNLPEYKSPNQEMADAGFEDDVTYAANLEKAALDPKSNREPYPGPYTNDTNGTNGSELSGTTFTTVENDADETDLGESQDSDDTVLDAGTIHISDDATLILDEADPGESVMVPPSASSKGRQLLQDSPAGTPTAAPTDSNSSEAIQERTETLEKQQQELLVLSLEQQNNRTAKLYANTPNISNETAITTRGQGNLTVSNPPPSNSSTFLNHTSEAEQARQAQQAQDRLTAEVTQEQQKLTDDVIQQQAERTAVSQAWVKQRMVACGCSMPALAPEPAADAIAAIPSSSDSS